ncbi:MAG: thioesterase family protein [Methanoregula sp.]|nr:thioesterase family protein [Methanoregula sp.]
MNLLDKDTALTEIEPYHYQLRVSGNWSISGIPNGGYLLALLANAMMQRSDKKSTPILTVNYLSRTEPGEAQILVEEISRSAQFNRLQARLTQNGKERMRAMGTFAVETGECFIKRYEKASPEISPLKDCVAIPEMPTYTLYSQMDARLDPACAGWMQGRLSGISEHKGWISFKDGRPYDIMAVALVADAFPPPLFASQGLIAWVPTIELTVNIRNIPQTRWLKCIFRTNFINCGLLEADGEIWDESSELIAISRQIAQFRKIE